VDPNTFHTIYSLNLVRLIILVPFLLAFCPISFRVCTPAIDEKEIFGGDEWAMKAAALEIKVAPTYLTTQNCPDQ